MSPERELGWLRTLRQVRMLAMRITRPLVAGIAVAAGLTGCDHSQRQGRESPIQPYTPAQVRLAFAAAQLPLAPDPLANADSRVRAAFLTNGDISVVLYRNATGPKTLLLLGEEQTFVSSRNLIVTYPRKSRLLSSIRRALRTLRQGEAAPS
jgi:hypothetical protein